MGVRRAVLAILVAGSSCIWLRRRRGKLVPGNTSVGHGEQLGEVVAVRCEDGESRK